jgi:hypothetical protein
MLDGSVHLSGLSFCRSPPSAQELCPRQIRELIRDDTALLRQGIASVGKTPEQGVSSFVADFLRYAAVSSRPEAARSPFAVGAVVERGSVR